VKSGDKGSRTRFSSLQDDRKRTISGIRGRGLRDGESKGSIESGSRACRRRKTWPCGGVPEGKG